MGLNSGRVWWSWFSLCYIGPVHRLLAFTPTPEHSLPITNRRFVICAHKAFRLYLNVIMALWYFLLSKTAFLSIYDCAMTHSIDNGCTIDGIKSDNYYLDFCNNFDFAWWVSDTLNHYSKIRLFVLTRILLLRMH